MNTFIEALKTGALGLWNDAYAAAVADFDWLSELRETCQEPIWHEEGDVAKHTEMVLCALGEILREDNITLSPARWTVLWLAALFHDIGKCKTTKAREIKGHTRIVSPHHAACGASYIAYRLMEYDLPLPWILEIISLVALHHEPTCLTRSNAGPGRYWELSRQCDVQLLYLLEKADRRGRICRDQRTLLEDLECFKLCCETYGIWENTGLWGERQHTQIREQERGLGVRDFQDALREAFPQLSAETQEMLLRESLWDYAKDVICHPQEAVQRAYRWLERPYSRVFLMMGPSGSGKSRWIREHLSPEGMEVISLDALREEYTGRRDCQTRNGKVAGLARERLKACLRSGQDAVYDATSLTKQLRQKIWRLVRDYGGHTTLVVMCTPPSVQERQNRQRRHALPSKVLEKQWKQLEWCGLDEAHTVRFVQHCRR
ncbi:MAG: AAA family ATPase [Myxococcota bacterium]